MKKNLIALAIFGAFSGAALAQSNVTLYGIIDVNFQYNDPDAAVRHRPAALTRVTSRVAAGVFAVREALSPNLNAVFTLEGGYRRSAHGTIGARGRPPVRPSGMGWLVWRLGHVGSRPRRDLLVGHGLIRHVR